MLFSLEPCGLAGFVQQLTQNRSMLQKFKKGASLDQTVDL